MIGKNYLLEYFCNELNFTNHEKNFVCFYFIILSFGSIINAQEEGGGLPNPGGPDGGTWEEVLYQTYPRQITCKGDGSLECKWP